MGLPAVHSVLRWVESATGKSSKKRGRRGEQSAIYFTRLPEVRRCALCDERARDEVEEKQEPAHMEGFETEYTPRENGRSRGRRGRGAEQRDRGGCEGFLRLPATLYPFTPRRIHVDWNEPDVI